MHHGQECTTHQQTCEKASFNDITEEQHYNMGGFSKHMTYDPFLRALDTVKADMNHLDGVSCLRRDKEPV
jgi:hypothetical protein